MEGAVYASIAVALTLVLGYVLIAWGGSVGKGLLYALLTPFVLVLAGVALGLAVGFAAGCAMPWVKRFRQQQAGALAADPYEAALALASKLPPARWAPFMFALRERWKLGPAITAAATEFMARTPERIQ